MINIIRKGLPNLPPRMQKLLIDERGYPVPWFVQWVNGAPNFQIVSPLRFRQAVKFNNCWICGERLGSRKTFVLGPLNIINRVTSEPSCHYDCARFAAQACPFLLLPKAQYKDAPQGSSMLPGATGRNPGVCALWTTKTFKTVPAGQGKKLIIVSEPVSVDWYALGKLATREQVRESLEDGLGLIYLPLARDPLTPKRIENIIEFENDYARAQKYLPSAEDEQYHDGF